MIHWAKQRDLKKKNVEKSNDAQESLYHDVICTIPCCSFDSFVLKVFSKE